MGNAQASREISLEEMEQFEMQVDEDYNPSGELSERAARRDYMFKLRNREAEELRLKYLGPKLPDGEVRSGPTNHHVSRKTIPARVKPRSFGKVKYIFQELEEPKNSERNAQP